MYIKYAIICMVIYMYREIEEKLQEWKSRKKHKPLILSGARQTGKTYSVKKFAQTYSDSIYINFERELDLKDALSKTANPSEIIELLKLYYPQKDLNNNDIIIIFDEVQACPMVLTTIKFLSEETDYDYILTGNLLGIAITHTNSYPVGYVESMTLLPMSFKEFLIAQGITNEQIDSLKQNYDTRTPVLEPIHKKYLEYFRLYIILGGMPEVIQNYIQTKDIPSSRKIQKEIIEGYYRDMAKYASSSDKIKTHDCFKSIPSQLAKENKKFQYKLIQSGGNARHFESSLQWLKDSGTILPCYRLKCIDYPPTAYRELSVFKIYIFDTGLLMSMFDDTSVSEIYTNNLGIYKGAIYENIAAQILHTNHNDLYYFEPSSRSEIDFIYEYEGHLCPIEIKSSENTRSKSLLAYIDKYNPKRAFRFSTKNINISGKIESYPIYMLMFL